MSMPEKFLPLAAMEKVLKKQGAERVSDGAKEVMKSAIEEIAEQIARHAVRLAKHAGRKTVMGSDIKLAAKHVR